jgi:hypothetical protein
MQFSDGESYDGGFTGVPFSRIWGEKWQIMIHHWGNIRLIAPFVKIRYKMTSENIPIVAFWMADRLRDGLKQGQNEKKGCFGTFIRKFHRLIPKLILSLRNPFRICHSHQDIRDLLFHRDHFSDGNFQYPGRSGGPFSRI